MFNQHLLGNIYVLEPENPANATASNPSIAIECVRLQYPLANVACMLIAFVARLFKLELHYSFVTFNVTV